MHVPATRAPLASFTRRASTSKGYLQASPRFHIRVSFREPVSGPVLVGRGRYVGLGLLIPRP